jgi:HK97 family phage prohead protease
MQEHFLLFNVKSLEFNNTDQKGHFVAIASTQNKDLVNEIVVQDGISFASNKVPFLHEHKNNEALGIIYNHSIIEEGLKVEGFFDLNNNIKSTLNNRQKESAYILAKNGLGQLSIGYKVLASHMEGDVRYLDKIQITEISFTVNPANTDTYFADVKSLDNEALRIKQAFKDLGTQMSIENTIEKIKKCDRRGELSKIIRTQMNCNRKQANNFIDAIKSFCDKKNTLTTKNNNILIKLTTDDSACNDIVAENGLVKPIDDSMASNKFRRFYGTLYSSNKKS